MYFYFLFFKDHYFVTTSQQNLEINFVYLFILIYQVILIKKNSNPKIWASTKFCASIGFTLLYFKMDVMPLVPETKMADVSILIGLRNLLARRTTWLVLNHTSATSIISRVFWSLLNDKYFL